MKRGIATILIILLILVIGVISTAIYLILAGESTEESTETAPEKTKAPVVEDVPENITQDEIIQNETENNLTNVTESVFIDLKASNLSLSHDCESGSNGTCELTIIGKVENSGTADVDKRFVMHFLDTTTSDFGLISSPTNTEKILVGAEKEFVTSYKNLSHGTYFIQFKVDAVNNIEESNETNNQITKFIKA